MQECNGWHFTFIDTWNEHMAHPFNFQYDGKGLENVVLRRFTRILSQQPEKLEQLDTKFIADLSLLCVRLSTHHRNELNDDEWNAMAEAVKARKSELDDIIAAEPGPIRQARARNALRALNEHLNLPRMAAESAATHH